MRRMKKRLRQINRNASRAPQGWQASAPVEHGTPTRFRRRALLKGRNTG